MPIKPSKYYCNMRNCFDIVGEFPSQFIVFRQVVDAFVGYDPVERDYIGSIRSGGLMSVIHRFSIWGRV